VKIPLGGATSGLRLGDIMPARSLVALVLGGGTVALGIYAYHIQVHDLHTSREHAAAQLAVGWAFVAAGLVAWLQRPKNRLGPLLVAAGAAYLARQLRYSFDAWLFTIFFALGELPYALVPHSVLAYPTGRVVGRAERAVLKVGYASLLVVPFAILLFYDGSRKLLFYNSSRPHHSLILVHGSADTVEALQKALVVFYFGILGTLFIALILRRFWRATPRSRRILAPLLVAAVAIALRALYECVRTFVSQPVASEYLFWWQVAAFITLPLALAAGMLRAHLARAGVGDLVVELEHAGPQAFRDALARSLGDPTLEVAFWLPDRGSYADAAGEPVELPEDGGRAVTRLEHDGKPLAAIVHDPSLLEEPRLIQGAGAAARLALENERLQAEIRAQLAEVKQSRVRIVTATDEERRRIERDLHDGAQQRLAALALQLRSAQRRLGSRDVDPEVSALLDSAVAELQAANEELRELVRGVYPAILTEDGLAAALESLADRNPFPIELDVPEGRFPARVEATAYFVASEGLANVAKHAQASKASVCISRSNGVLSVEIADDGVGGAQLHEGSGLSGLSDRVEALGGRLRIRSPLGEGTRVFAEIPYRS
jgi:signal transduction histidine kinase